MNIETYERTERPVYAAFAAVVSSIIRAALASEKPSYRLQQVSDRAKDVDSLRKKIATRTTDPEKIEDDIKDLAGCRVVFYTNADVARFLNSPLMSDNFEIVDRKTHQPGPAEQEAGKLYIAINFTVRLRVERAALPEYAAYAGLKCEVQVVTILNHALAEISHDITYKAPELDGFGKKALEAVGRRMAKVMRDYIVPAGYELQNITSDFERVLAGKQAFDQGTLDEIVDAADNNARHAALERLKEQVLPQLDDIPTRYPRILPKLLESVTRAVATPPKEIETPVGNYPGKSAGDVLEKVIEIIRRYWPADVPATVDTLFELFRGATTDEDRKKVLSLGETIAGHDMNAWKQVGPWVQRVVLDKVSAIPTEARMPLLPLLAKMLGEVLSPNVEGTTSNSTTVTLHRGTVVVSDELIAVRNGAIELLSEIVEASTSEEEYLTALNALDEASTTPTMGPYGNDLARVVVVNSQAIVALHTRLAGSMPFEVLRTRENHLHRLRRTFRQLPENMRADDALAREADVLVAAIENYRDVINANQDFVIYKTLVGYDSVFPVDWENDDFDHTRKDAYRQARIDEFVAEVSEDTKEYWFGIVTRCAQTESVDRATFPPFAMFLKQLGEKKPAVMLWMIDQMEKGNG